MSQSQQWALVINELDNIVLNNYWRKYHTYLELGWDDASIKEYIGQKKFTMQIASFNTPTVSFSASSRRNRFYEVYNKPGMLDQDVLWGNAIESLKKIDEKYKIFIISSRTEDLKEKTLEVMKKLNFPLDRLKIFFKKTNEKLFVYRKKCIQSIKEQFEGGIGICLSPAESTLFERVDYTPLGFSSLKEREEFNNKIQVVCQDWAQIQASLQC